MKLSDHRSLLAIDPCPRGIAFVVFENGELLDWGCRTKRKDDADLHAVVDRLIDGYAADVVIMEDAEADGCRRKPRLRAMLLSIARHLARRRVKLTRVARRDVRSAWAERGFMNKEAIAKAIAMRFTELQPLVPPHRKPHTPPAKRINIFDAAALLLHVASNVSELLGR